MRQAKNIKEEKLLNNTIWSYFSKVQDPRVEDNQKYEFKHLIVAIVCGIICGANNIESIVNYIESKADWFREKLGLQKPPSYKTIWWLLVLVDPEELNRAFNSFVQDIRQALWGSQPEDLELVAIDGKTSRGTARIGIKALHTVSAWSSSLQLLLGQVKTDEKSNEITAIPKLLEIIDLKGKIITIDAMGCQASIAEQIVEEGGDYILALKGNQETIHEETKAIFKELDFYEKNRDVAKAQIEEACSMEKGHGRIEERKVKVCRDVGWIKQIGKWRSVNSVIEVFSKRTLNGKVSTEKRYYLSSLEGKAEDFLKWIRDHWSVESFHWTLDVAFKDDHFQGYTGNLAENFSLLQRLTLVLLKRETSLKKSIPKKRERAGWNNKYLMKILEV